jgi:hypothetical protein
MAPWCSRTTAVQGGVRELVLPVKAVLALWIIVVVVPIARALISMSFVVLIAEEPMIGAVFSAALETFLVGTFVLVGQLVVVPVMRDVTVVIIIMSKGGYNGYTQHKYRSC